MNSGESPLPRSIRGLAGVLVNHPISVSVRKQNARSRRTQERMIKAGEPVQ